MKQYDHKKIENKWQKAWKVRKVYKTEDSSKKPKFYVLDMFPYPSGEGLHVGHPKGYIATDIVSRMKRMQGFNVLHPMGFDAFGLPAENYAIKMKVNPAVAVAKNVARFKKQLEILGFDYDWSREVNTTDPKFYKWTQWAFLKLLEKGLAYESFEPINWCPSCKTGLANEDVEDGKCERCGTPVEKKPMRQWVIRITDYADRLLKDIDTLDWPESIKESQRNWIGRSEGAEIDFALKGRKEKLRVFTTRPDTLYGVTYMVVAPEHPFVTELLKHKENLKNHDDVVKYVAHARMMTQIERTDAKKEKTGVQLQGVSAINPANGQEVSVWVADYVLADYGTGAVMAVPAHDERDFAFAKKYNLPVKIVVEPKFVGTKGDGAVKPGLPFIKRNVVSIVVRNPKNGMYLCNSWKSFHMQGLFTGGIEIGEDMIEAARREILEETGYKNLKFVRKSTISINTYFYQRVKQQNRQAHFSFVFFDLENEERAPIDEKEAAIHDIVWKKREELKDFFTVYEGSFILNILDNDDYVHTDPGILADSGDFSGKDSEEAKKLITSHVDGKWVVRYRLKDWVFSRQRYWGEPFPILHSSEYSDVSKEIKPRIDINFYHKDIWDALIAGTKTVETRVLNPHEPHRLFGDIKAGDYIAGTFKKTGEKKVFKVKSVYRWKDLGELWADKPIHGKIFRKSYKSLAELTSAYGKLAPGYAEKANKEGIVGWEVELANVAVPVPEKDLPIVLPKVKSYEPTGTGESPLADISKWVNVKMGKGKTAKTFRRETNTMPQWAGSSWYYLRYMDPKNQRALVDPKNEKYWNQVDFYVGGAEHATRHLIYARFWHKFLYDLGVVSTIEPFKKLQSVGLIMGEDGQKMSKRFGNVVNPDDIVAMYGADTLRIYEMFMGPFDQSIAWSTKGMVGSRRFIERVWKLSEKVDKKASLPKHADILLNKTILKVSEDIASIRHNTAISSLMILSNELEACSSLPKETYETLLKLLAPFAPHMAEELWAGLGNKKSIHVSSWPVADHSKIAEELATIAVQVNGKTRATFQAPKTATQPELEKAALALDDVKKWLGGKNPTKVIVIPGRMVSIVVKI